MPKLVMWSQEKSLRKKSRGIISTRGKTRGSSTNLWSVEDGTVVGEHARDREDFVGDLVKDQDLLLIRKFVPRMTGSKRRIVNSQIF